MSRTEKPAVHPTSRAEERPAATVTDCPGGAREPDVLLDVPDLKVEEITLEVRTCALAWRCKRMS